MYIHEEIAKAVLPLLEKYNLELVELIGEMNHAAWELSVLNKHGIEELITKLNETHNVELTGGALAPSSDRRERG